VRRTTLFGLAVAGLASLPGALAARADSILLTDGRTVEAPKITKDEKGYRLAFKNGDVVVPAALVKEALFAGEGGYEPKNDEEKAKLEKGLVPFEGRWVAKAERDATMAKRAAAAKKKIEEAKAHRLWRNRYKVKTQNFDFEFTIPPEIAQGYMDLMETYYSNFTKQFGCARPPKERLPVCLYHDYQSFLDTGGAGYGVLAYYRFVSPRELNFFYDRVRPEETVAIMFHEAQHYLANLIDLNFNYPHNFGESMAEYYGGSKWDPVKKTMTTGGLQEGRLTEVLTDIQGGETRSLEKFLKNELGYDDYTWGWTFVHFMMESPKYTAKFKEFYKALARGKDVERKDAGNPGMRTVGGDALLAAFKKYVGVKDISALEKEWMDYVKSKLKVESVFGYEEAAFAALNTGQTIKAERYFKLAVEKGSRNSKIYLRYGDVRRQKGSGEEAMELYQKGLEIDPLDADLYVAMGRAKRSAGGEENEKEGRRLLALAQEVDPDNADLAMLLEDALEKSDGG
jgi:tetratricopeptide (TPR) repeat protein